MGDSLVVEVWLRDCGVGIIYGWVVEGLVEGARDSDTGLCIVVEAGFEEQDTWCGSKR